MEADNQLPFLDLLLIKNLDGSIGRHVFRKSTHIYLYLNSSSHHHPCQKFGVLKMLILRAFRICNDKHIDLELSHLRHVFQMNGYSSRQIKKAIKDTELFLHSQSKPRRISPSHRVSLPFVNGISHKIAKILANKCIRSMFKPFSLVKHRIRSLKDSKDTLLQSGVYKIECSCGVPYIGETRRAIKTRLKEHGVDIQHDRVAKSALGEHSSTTKHHICLEKAQVLCHEDNFFRRKIKEAIEIGNHPWNLNHDEGLFLSHSWQPLLSSIRNLSCHP